MKKDWKGCPPKYRNLAIVDDDENRRRQFREFLANEFPKLEVSDYETIFECYQGWRRFDFVVIDVSSVAPNMMGDVAFAYGPIAKFLEAYPATEVIVLSAMSRNATEDVIDDVKRAVPEAKIRYGGRGDWESPHGGLKDVLCGLMKPEDFEWTKIKKRK